MATIIQKVKEQLPLITKDLPDPDTYFKYTKTCHVFKGECIYSIHNSDGYLYWVKTDPKEEPIMFHTYGEGLRYLWDTERQGPFPFYILPNASIVGHSLG